ncbi:hypothetical protein ACFLT4_03300 [Chloroflexota bacterium]
MKDKQVDRRQIRIFGIGLIVIVSIIASLQTYWGRTEVGIGLFAAAVLLLIVVIFVPTGLIPLYKLMLCISRAIGFVMTPVILGLVFYLVFTPVGVLLRLIRKDILDRRFEVSSDSYWKPKEPMSDDLDRYERQY